MFHAAPGRVCTEALHSTGKHDSMEDNSMNTARFGVIGLGMWGERHVLTYRQDELLRALRR